MLAWTELRTSWTRKRVMCLNDAIEGSVVNVCTFAAMIGHFVGDGFGMVYTCYC